MKRLAIIDDWGGMVSAQTVWKRLEGRARIDAFQDTLADEDALAQRLAPYEIVVPTRERTFSAGAGRDRSISPPPPRAASS